jgi:hypothetical protein
MNVSSTQRVDAPSSARTTKPASATGKPKTESTADARKIAEEARMKKENDPVAQKLKKVQTVDVTA